MSRRETDSSRERAQINGFIDYIKRIIPGADSESQAMIVLQALQVLLPGERFDHVLLEFTSGNEFEIEPDESEIKKEDIVILPMPGSLKVLIERPVNEELLHSLGIEYDERRREISRHGKSVHLTTRENELFFLLVRLQGKELLSMFLLEEWATNSEKLVSIVEAHRCRLNIKIQMLTTPEELAMGKTLSVKNIKKSGYFVDFAYIKPKSKNVD